MTARSWSIKSGNWYGFHCASKTHANPLNILVHLQLLFAQRWNELGDGHYANLKPKHNFPIPFNTKFCSAAIWLKFQCQIITQNSTPQFGVRVDLGGKKWYQSKCRPHIHIRLLYTLQAYLAPFGHNIQHSRQSNWYRPWCYSIGGLIMWNVRVLK